jgi:ATP-dependent RNA helicase DDX27
MESSGDESDASAMSADPVGFFQGLDPTKSYRLKDAYEDNWSSDEVASSAEAPEEEERDLLPDDDNSDEEGASDDGALLQPDGEDAVNAMFKDEEEKGSEPDPEAPSGPVDEDLDDDTAIQAALARFDQAVEADSESDAEGAPKKELPPLPNYMKWRFMRLSKPVMKAVENAGFQLPTPVQAQVIRPALHGMDLCCRAVTGSGKTAAFVLPMLDRLRFTPPHPVGSVRGLILEPTREVAFQAQNVIRQLGMYTNVTSCVIAGGVPTLEQVRFLQQPVTIAVATPGRLIDLVLNHKCSLNDVEIFVLDEADKLLSCGFTRDIQEIIRHLPVRRQTLQFSATMTRDVDRLADLALRKPIDIEVGPIGTAQSLRQEFVRVPLGKAFLKPAMLAVICTKYYKRGVMVFCARRDMAHHMHTLFSLLDLSSVELHGDMNQAQRMQALSDFRNRVSPIMFTTDIAQRGLDIAGCRTVINYNLPNILPAYIHRVGRTARMGKQGVAVSFVDDGTDDIKMLEQIVSLARINNSNAKAKVIAVPEGIKNRKLEDPDVEEWERKVDAVEGALKDRLMEHKAMQQINDLERKVTVAQNRIEHKKEIQKRGKPAWHLSGKERKEAKEWKKAEAEATAVQVDRGRLAAEQARRTAKYNATDLENRPIKTPAFSKKNKKYEDRTRRREEDKEARTKRGPERLSNQERKRKRREKKRAIVKGKQQKGVLPKKEPKVKRKSSLKKAKDGQTKPEAKSRIKDMARKGTFKSKTRYKRR